MIRSDNNIRKSHQGGFTLIEVILASLTAATIILAMKMTLFTCLNLREKAQKTIDELLPRHRVVQILKKDLMNCLRTGGSLAQSFIGETTGAVEFLEDSIEFHTTTGVIRDYTVWSDLQRVQYLLVDPLTLNKNENQGKDLVRLVTRNLLSDLEEIPDYQRLLSGVLSMGILYYDGETWIDTWDSEEQDPKVPKAVRMSIGLMPEQKPA
ncbi:MAG TPA: hypothetical protein EYQ50_05465, partial [Verrucomicrobiales bacterium]|nr:hypothetical protein [Verrucomicrobiales bacterium]